MPIYEYQCPHCHKNFEEWLKSDDDASTHPCPACGTSSPRIISQTTFILKGGGWYVTEYGSHHADNENAPSETAQAASNDAPNDGKADADAKGSTENAASGAKPETKPSSAAAATKKNAQPVSGSAASPASGTKPAASA